MQCQATVVAAIGCLLHYVVSTAASHSHGSATHLAEAQLGPKALLVSHQLDHTGAPIALLQLADTLLESGWHIRMLAFRAGSQTQHVAQLLPLRVMGSEDKSAADETFCDALIVPQAYDVIVVNTVVVETVWFWLRSHVEAFGDAFSARLVWLVHELASDFRPDAVTLHLLAGHFRYLVVDTDFSAASWGSLIEQHAANMSHKLPPLLLDRRVRVIHPILRMDLLRKSQTALQQLRARRAETRAAHNLPASAVVALFAGSLIKKKGPLQVLRAADLACAQLCGCTTMSGAATAAAAAVGSRALLVERSASGGSSFRSSTATVTQTVTDGQAAAAQGGNSSSSSSSTRVRCCSISAAAAACPHVVFAYSNTNMPTLQEFEAAVAALEALPAGHVRMLRPERQEHVFELYAAADVFVMNSECENFGMVTLEAMAHGLPVLAAARCGTLDIVRHMETGLLHDDADAVDQLAGHLLLMMHPIPTTTTTTTTAFRTAGSPTDAAVATASAAAVLSDLPATAAAASRALLYQHLGPITPAAAAAATAAVTTGLADPSAASKALLYQRLVLAGRALFQERFSPVRERRAWGELLAEVVGAAAEFDAEEVARWRRLSELAYISGDPSVGLPTWLARGRQAAARMLNRHLHGPPNISIAAHTNHPYHSSTHHHPQSRHSHHQARHYYGHDTHGDAVDGSRNATRHHHYQQVHLWQPPLQWEWLRHADAPIAVANAPSVALGRWLYLWGGSRGAHGDRVNNAMWKLDMGVAIDGGGGPEWAQVATPLPPGLGRLAAAAVSHLDRFIYMAGGQVHGQCDVPTAAAFRFDTQLLVWQRLPDLPAPLWGASAVILDGVLTLLGGATMGSDSAEIWRYSHLQLRLQPDGDPPSAGAWQVRPPPPSVILSPSAIVMRAAGAGDSGAGPTAGVGRRRLRGASVSTVRLFGGAITVVQKDNATSGSIKCRPYVKGTNEAVAAAHGVFTFDEGVSTEDGGTSGGSAGGWHEGRAKFPIGVSHMGSCALALPNSGGGGMASHGVGGASDVALFVGGLHEQRWLSRYLYAYHAPSNTITTVGRLPHGRLAGAACGVWAGRLWIATGQVSPGKCNGCTVPGPVVAQTWSAPLPLELSGRSSSGHLGR